MRQYSLFLHMQCRVLIFVLTLALLMLLSVPSLPSALADGGAPNLAYVSGAAAGVSVIDVAQQQVTSTIKATGDPHNILLSGDARFLYVTQPQTGQVQFIAAKTGETFCTVKVPGQPSLLAIDYGANTLFTGGNASSTVTAIDVRNCNIKHTLQVPGPVKGLALASVASSLSNGTGNQLWVSAGNKLTVYDDAKWNQINSISIPGDPQYISIPAGATVYATTTQGSVIAVDLNSYKVVPLISGGQYGPMDYDAITGEVYVPDQTHNRLVVLSPVNAGFTPPREPSRTISVAGHPESVAITSDGQLGFVALASGDVAMLDIPGRETIKTIAVGGNPHFIITGLYPPVIGTTPQQANTWGIILNVLAYILVLALLIIPIVVYRRYAKVRPNREE
jgi:DNA-binding beta-propeller fold protein YncE